jgi:methionyl-tRNA formyltransferase
VRVLLVGDTHGVVQTLRVVPNLGMVGIVAAANRPQYHAELRTIAASHGAPLLIQPQRRAASYNDFIAAAAACRPELILCNSYSMILRDDLLALASAGAVNVHAGKVPEYRGANPIQWAIIGDEREAGVTLHHIAAEIDAGDVISERSVPIHFADTWRDVADRLAPAAESMLATELPGLLAGRVVAGHPQDPALAIMRRRRTPEDGRLDWSASVLRIYNQVRALVAPLPGAFYERDGERVVLDQYLPPSEIAALKYAPEVGGFRLEQGGFALAPQPATDDLVQFDVQKKSIQVGTCGLTDFDPVSRSARPWSLPPNHELIDLVTRFARDELGLTVR